MRIAQPGVTDGECRARIGKFRPAIAARTDADPAPVSQVTRYRTIVSVPRLSGTGQPGYGCPVIKKEPSSL
jgi:hypothetical protein